jgi:uncharacterized protein YjbI with pentapeptide repeats
VNIAAMSMIQIAGTPRSLAELAFVAGLWPCEVCSDRRPVAWTIGGVGAAWTVRARCPRCATERAFVFRCDHDLVGVVPPALELGGRAPSSILEPVDLVRELDRLIPSIVTRPERLVDPAWSANEAVVDRVRTALHELAKFVAAEAVPIEAHRTGAGALDQAARPERYTRTWIAAQLREWDAVAARIASDAPRILAADRAVSRATPPRGRIDTATLAAHHAWLARGRNGAGRLDVVTADVRECAIAAGQLDGCRLEGVALDRAELAAIRLADAELVDVSFAGARLEAASFAGAVAVDCAFDGALAARARFDRAVLERGSLVETNLERTSWHGAAVTRVRLAGAELRGAQLGKAHFVHCDLRDASLADVLAIGAVFERCDLRGADLTGAALSGAIFRACLFAGAHGVPSAVLGWRVEDADFSDAGDGTDLGDASDLLEELGAQH